MWAVAKHFFAMAVKPSELVCEPCVARLHFGQEITLSNFTAFANQGKIGF